MTQRKDTQLWNERPIHKDNTDYDATECHQLFEAYRRINDLQDRFEELVHAVKRAQTLKEVRKLSTVLQKTKAELEDAIKTLEVVNGLAMERICRRYGAIIELLQRFRANDYIAGPTMHEETDSAAQTARRCSERKDQEKRGCDVYLKLKHKLRQTYKTLCWRQKEARAAQQRVTRGQQKTTHVEDKQVKKANGQNQAALKAFLQVHDTHDEEIKTYPECENKMKLAEDRQTRAKKRQRDALGRFARREQTHDSRSLASAQYS